MLWAFLKTNWVAVTAAAVILTLSGVVAITRSELKAANATVITRTIERDAWKGHAETLVALNASQAAAVARIEDNQRLLNGQLRTLASSFNSDQIRTQADENVSQLDAALNARYGELVGLRDAATVVTAD